MLNASLRKAGIRKIITSRKVMENPVFAKFKDTLDAEFIYLEDLRDCLTRGDKLAGAFGAYATPAWLLDRILGLTKSAATTCSRSSSPPARPACPRR